jgi:hypothetical protein
MYKNRVPREDMMYARNRVSAADRILASFESKCEEAGVTDCMLMAYSTLGDRSARLVLASHGPIGLEDAKSFVFASTDNKLIPIAASFSRSAGSDAYGLHYASIVAHKAALLMEAFDPQDTNKVCMNASATVFLDQTLGCTWDRKNINGKDYLVRNNGNLTRWAEQGILLLNATLTVRAHQAGSHQNRGWETFTDAAIRILAEEKEHLVFILWGAYAQRKGAFIDRSRHLVLTSAHPSPLSAYNGFFGNKHFSKTNEYLREHGETEIIW